MKNKILLLLSILLVTLSACHEEIYPLELETFDVRWFDDHSGTQNAGDKLTFSIQINATDPCADNQYITDWEFAYFVNGTFVGILRGDDNIETPSLHLDAEVVIANLGLPFQGPLLKGDVIEFRIWAQDNHGTEIEQTHRYVIED